MKSEVHKEVPTEQTAHCSHLTSVEKLSSVPQIGGQGSATENVTDPVFLIACSGKNWLKKKKKLSEGLI